MKTKGKSNIIIYQAPNGAIELKGDFDKETVWASQIEMSQIFDVNVPAISKHIKNIYLDGELDEKSTVSKMEIVQNENWRKVKRTVQFYNLDVLISVWYRINSITWTKFRQRATKTLNQHITQWYTINKKILQKNYHAFMKSVEEVKKLVSKTALRTDDVLELIKFFGQTWFSLDAYDKWEIPLRKQTSKTVHFHAQNLYDAIEKLKTDLLKKWVATDLFAQEKYTWSLEGILGNILQTAFGKDLYPSIESKAAHLLYFIIKDHPFNDGNKRTWAFSFVWFLQMVWYDFRAKITPEALTTITLLIATSDPKDKQRLIDLVMMMLQG